MIKINYEEASYILNYNLPHNFERFFCNHYLTRNNANSYTISCYVKWWFYILAFPITAIIHLFICLWDGGLKEFEFETRWVYAWNDCGGFNTLLDPNETRFGRMENIWNRHNPQ